MWPAAVKLTVDVQERLLQREPERPSTQGRSRGCASGGLRLRPPRCHGRCCRILQVRARQQHLNRAVKEAGISQVCKADRRAVY